jgi:hypothetical protein
MSFKVLVKIVVFLAILFTILFIGLNNRQSADFYSPGSSRASGPPRPRSCIS